MAEECIDYNCTEIGEHELLGQLCGGGRLSGAAHIIAGLCGTSLSSPSNATEINALLDAGTAKLIMNLKVALGVPSPILVDSTTACGTQDVATYDRTFTVEDFNVTQANCDFYSGMFGGRRFAWALLFECTTEGLTDQVTFINTTWKAFGGRNFENTNATFQKYSWTGSWRSKAEPCQFDAPTGITGLDA